MSWMSTGRKWALLGSYHDCHIIVVDTVIIDGRLQKMGVLLQPAEVLASGVDVLRTLRLTISACSVDLKAF